MAAVDGDSRQKSYIDTNFHNTETKSNLTPQIHIYRVPFFSQKQIFKNRI